MLALKLALMLALNAGSHLTGLRLRRKTNSKSKPRTNTMIRPTRSALYMPGSNARALEKAKSLAADAMILDLEDAVAPDAKATARAQVCAAVAAGGFGPRQVVIRINALDTPWGHADIDAAAKAKPDADPAAEAEHRRGHLIEPACAAPCRSARTTKLWAMIETPRAVLNAREIAASVDACRLTA